MNFGRLLHRHGLRRSRLPGVAMPESAWPPGPGAAGAQRPGGAATAADERSDPPRPHRRRLLAFGALALGVALTASLGHWQTRRAAQKLALQARQDAVAHAPAVAVDATHLAALPSHLPERVRLSGNWDAGHAVWLDNRSHDGRAGFWLVMPLVIGPGAVVLVQRGWAPRDPLERARLPPVETAPTATIEGLALERLPRAFALGNAAPEAPLPAIWQNLDFDAFERVSGLQVARAVVQQTDPDGGGLLRQWPRPAQDVDMHRGYAFQWFALSALLVVLGIAAAWRERRGGARPEPPPQAPGPPSHGVRR
jgi:surfeit locus 1 family protein